MQQTVKLGIKNQYGEFLLIQREEKDGLENAGLWDVVGGAVEPGETPKGAIIREKNEETGGIDVDIEYLGKFHYDGIEYILFLGKTNARIEDVKTEFDQEKGYFGLDEILTMDTILNLKKLLIQYRPVLESY